MNESIEEYGGDLFSIKITLVGSSSVGKTTLINQYINHIFLESAISTIGSDKFSKIEKINNSEIKLIIWDTAGQERYRSLSPMFLKGSNVIILVYDITNKSSFDEIETIWLDFVKENAHNYILCVAANKCDLYEDEEVDEQIARNFAKKEGAYFFSTTAKNYNSIEQLFLNLTQMYIEKYGIVNQNKKDKRNKNNKTNCC